MIRETYEDLLIPGKRYRVKQAFLDARKRVHPVGETWTFQGYMPSGFAEATSIYALADDKSPCNFAIDWNNTQGDLGIGNIAEYIEPA